MTVDELRFTIPSGLLLVLLGWGLGGGGDSDAASGKISIICKCLHRIKQDLKKYFLNNKDVKIVLNHRRLYRKN